MKPFQKNKKKWCRILIAFICPEQRKGQKRNDAFNPIIIRIYQARSPAAVESPSHGQMTPSTKMNDITEINTRQIRKSTLELGRVMQPVPIIELHH